MSGELLLLFTVLRDIIATKSYILATSTILFYDYLLTLADEVQYVWSGEKSWMFWLFIINRYFPFPYQIWQLAAESGTLSPKICTKTLWFPTLAFAVCTLLAQVVLTVRVYVVTTKNIPITVGFVVISAAQLVLGIWAIVLVVRGAQPQVVPLEAYRTCAFPQHRTLEVAYTSVSLLYDLLAFSLTIFLAVKSKASGLRVTGVLRTIAGDSVLYFLVIFTSHFVLEMTLILGRESIQLLPGPGIVVYLPVMISRIILSLKKAADPPKMGWPLEAPSVDSTDSRDAGYSRPQGAVHLAESGVSLEA